MIDFPEKTAKAKLRKDKKRGYIHLDELGYQEALELWYDFKTKLKQERDTDDKRISKGI